MGRRQRAVAPRIAPIWPRSTGYPDLGGCLLASPSSNQIWRMTVTPFTAATHSDSIGCNRSQPGNFWLCVAANERIVASTPHSAAQPQPLPLQLSGTVMVCNKRCAHIHSLAACSTKVCGVSAICNWVSNIIIITSLRLGKSLRCAALLISALLSSSVCLCVCFNARARVSHLPRGIGANVRARAATDKLPLSRARPGHAPPLQRRLLVLVRSSCTPLT